VPKVEIRGTGIDPELDPQRLAPVEPLREMLPVLAVNDSA
jgi:hypothetical protein